ncbi:cystatin-B [Alligator mississippiensis]|uniref:cystatin-B n=1 Tax=Alligator mississippiensis TaxID=8496 RepID=UPI000906FB26|nr:cystatin-B [Alligator mississippiensis]
METAVCGGLTPTEPAIPEVQKIADQVKSQLEAKTDKTYTVFKAIIYRTQLVGGTNYFIKVKPQLEGKENKTYQCFTATEYKSQVVAGTNYFIKVQVGENDYVHLRVFVSLPHTNEGITFTSYQTGKTGGDPLTYF